eukprot:4349313-Pleurochrysis_carterae.AAC.2
MAVACGGVPIEETMKTMTGGALTARQFWALLCSSSHARRLHRPPKVVLPHFSTRSCSFTALFMSSQRPMGAGAPARTISKELSSGIRQLAQSVSMVNSPLGSLLNWHSFLRKLVCLWAGATLLLATPSRMLDLLEKGCLDFSLVRRSHAAISVASFQQHPQLRGMRRPGSEAARLRLLLERSSTDPG